MEVTINQKKDNVLVGRVEVQGLVQFTGATPDNLQLVESLAKQLKAPSSNIVVKTIHTNFSRSDAAFFAYVYADENSRRKYERVTKHLRKKMEEASKKEAEEKKAAEAAA